MLKWFFHIKFGRKISQNLIEECNCSFYHLSFLDLTKKPWWYIHITFVNASTHFYENSLFCCEVFSTNWCFLNFGMSHYCWKPFRYQELSSACEICSKKFNWNTFQYVNVLLKLQQTRDILYGRERNHCKNPEQITSVVYLHVVLLGMNEIETATEKDCMLLSCRVQVSVWTTLYNLLECQGTPCAKQAPCLTPSDINGVRTHNHLVSKRTLNHLDKLAKWLSCVVSTYLYSAFGCMLLSCHVRVPEWIYTP